MKYVWMTVAGFVVGALIGAAAVLVNPLTASDEAGLTGFKTQLTYQLPGDAVVLTHGGRAPLERKPFAVEPLWENTIRSTSLAMLTLTDESGQPHAVATRAASPSKRTDLLTSGLLANDHWLISIPSDGSFFVVGESNLSSVVRDTLVRVTLLNRDWEGPRSYFPTAGPEIGSTALVVGATGRYAQLRGRAVERWEIDDFSRAEGLAAASGELHLLLDAPAPSLDGPELSDALPASAPPPADLTPAAAN